MGLADIFYRFGVSLIIGFLIGIQREYAYVKEENRPDIDQTLFAGARTFPCWASTGVRPPSWERPPARSG